MSSAAPAGNDAVNGGEEHPVTDVEGEALQQAVVMETVAVDNEVSDGGGQHEGCSSSPTAEQVGAEEGDADTGQQKDFDGDPEAATEVGEPVTDREEILESEAALRRQSIEGSTEPPAVSNHSPLSGILLFCPVSLNATFCIIIASLLDCLRSLVIILRGIKTTVVTGPHGRQSRSQ